MKRFFLFFFGGNDVCRNTHHLVQYAGYGIQEPGEEGLHCGPAHSRARCIVSQAFYTPPTCVAGASPI